MEHGHSLAETPMSSFEGQVPLPPFVLILILNPHEILVNIALTSQTLDLAVVQQHLTCHAGFVSIVTPEKGVLLERMLGNHSPSKVQRLSFYVLELLDLIVKDVKEKHPNQFKGKTACGINHFRKLQVSVALLL